MPSATYTFDELTAAGNYPLVTESDANFKVNLFNSDGSIIPIDGGGGDIWVRAGSGFSLTDLGSKYYANYDADHVTLSGGLVQDPIPDQSGNGRDLSFTAGGTSRWSQGTEFNGAKSLIVPNSSNAYHRTGMSDATGTYWADFCTFIARSPSQNCYATDNTSGGAGSGNFTADGAANLTGGAPLGVITLNTNITDTTQSVGHKTKTWKNGDQSTIAEANAAALVTNAKIVWGASNDGISFSFKGGSLRRYLAVNGGGTALTSDQIKGAEGIMAWDFPFGHYTLVSGHPWHDVSPIGKLAAPGTPTIVGAYPSGDGEITLMVVPGDEGNASCSFTALSTPGSISQTTTPTSGYSNSANSFFLKIPLDGLTNGTSYTATCTQFNAAGISSASSASASVTPTNSSLVPFAAHFNMGGASGSDEPDIFGGYTLTHNGTTASGTGFGGACRVLAGSDDFHILAADDVINCVNRDFALFIPTKPTALSGNQIAASSISGSGVPGIMDRYEGTARKFYIGDGGAYESNTVVSSASNGTEYDLAISFNHSTKVWSWSVNGAAVQTFNGSKVPATSGYDFYYGKWGGGQNFTGSLGPLGILNRTATNTELTTTSYNGGTIPRF